MLVFPSFRRVRAARRRVFTSVVLLATLIALVAMPPAQAQPEAAPLALAPADLQRLVDAALAGRPAAHTPQAVTYAPSRPLPAAMQPQRNPGPASLNDGYTPENDAIINWVNRNALNYPLQPNSPADLETIRQWTETERQRQQAAEALALQALQQSDAALNFGSAVFRSGGDPNVFFAQNPLPNTFTSAFRDPLQPGAGFDALNPIDATRNAVNLSLSRLSLYPSPFLNDLTNLLFTPSDTTPQPSLTPRLQPGACSTANPFQPTSITFLHLASRPVFVSLLDYSCQEVFYTVLLPGTVYEQLTFVGQTWRFRDSANNELLLGQPEVIIPDQSGFLYTIFDVPNAGATSTASASPSGMLEVETAQGAPNRPASPNTLEGLQARYAALTQMQLGNYYADPQVSQLRDELNQQVLLRLETDPLYVYWKQELATAQQRIEQALPSYAQVADLSARVAAWTAPSADPNEQRRRYAVRQSLLAAQATLEEERATFLAANPTLRDSLRDLERWLADRTAQLETDPDFVRWHAEWLIDWNIAYLASPAGVETARAVEQLSADFPTFAQYQQTRRELVDLLPGLDDTPPVQKYAAVQAEVDNDPAVAEQISAAYTAYLAEVEALLAPTEIPVLLERFYNSLNGLLQNDPEYRALQQLDQERIVALEQRRAAVRDAVAACFAANPECDPYADPAVTDLLYTTASSDLIADSAAFYERQNRFWYAFYTSQAYLDLENATKAALAGPLTSLQPQLQASQDAYERRTAAIPQLARLRAAGNTMLDELCPTGPALNSGPISDAAVAVCERLERLKTLDRQLGATSALANTRSTVFLPWISR